MKDDLQWLTGEGDLNLFAEKVNKDNKKGVIKHIDLGDDRYCDPDLISFRKRFTKKGYVLVPNIFSQNEIELFRNHVTEAVSTRLRDFNYRVDNNFYTQQFAQCLNLWEDFLEVRKIAFSQKLTRVAKSLLGVEKIRIWQDQALYKHPKSRNTSAHHDLPFWSLDNTQCLTAWIVLSREGSTLDNGALGYVPGSHTSGLRHFSNITTGTSVQDFDRRDQEILGDPLLGGEKPEFIEVKSGSVVFHHGLTVHLSKPNQTDKIRKVYTVVYMKDGTRRGSQIGVKDQQHFVVNRKGGEVEEGMLLDGPLTPIAYPINKLPPTPPSITLDEYLQSKGSLPRPHSTIDNSSKL